MAMPMHHDIPDIWAQTATGRAVSLLAPSPTDIDLFDDVAEQLSRITRYAGACQSGVYSVAQHSVLGADALYRETNRRDMAAAFLLHDAHEIYMGDWIRPATEALLVYAANAGRRDEILKDLGSLTAATVLRRCVKFAIDDMKTVLDAAIYDAAGMAFPLAPDVRRAVHTMDMRCLATERRHLLLPPPHPWGPEVESANPIRLMGKLRLWPWAEAADAFKDRLARYLPEVRRHKARPKTKRSTR
jgi:hypothetical protein